MTNFYLHDLTSDEFQSLVIDICRNILGSATLEFSQGKDGGRDGLYHGKAKDFNNLEGTFVIQAKWTAALEGSCTDKRFQDIIDEEIPKIKSLVEKNELDFYIIFTNRKLSADTNSYLTNKINIKTGAKHSYVIGVEQIGSYISQNNYLIQKYNLRPFKEPLRINPEDLKTIILNFDKNKENISEKIMEKKPKAFDIVDKNKINNLSEDYYKGSILKHSNLRFNEIDLFLEDPINDEFNELYKEVVSEFQSKILIRIKDLRFFEDIFDLLYDEIMHKLPELKNNKRLVNVFLHYMYINCDIGRIPEE